MDEIGVWLGGGGGEKIGGAALFSLWAHQNSITPNWGENTRENKSLIFEQLPLANTNVHHYAFFPFCLFHEFVSCSHLFLPSFYYRHYFLFCAHRFLLILVLGHCPFFLRDTAVILFCFSSSFSFFFF